MPDAPVGFFLTFGCYGARVHGEDKETVDRQHNLYGTPFLPADPERNSIERARMTEPPLLLDSTQRTIVLDALLEVCRYRNWTMLAAHVRATHVHCLVAGSASPSKMIGDFKKYATRHLRDRGMAQRHVWAELGSTRYVWTVESLERIARYIVDEQGEPMAVFDGRHVEQSEPAQ